LQQVRVVHTHEEVVFFSSCSAADPVWFEENQIQFKNVHIPGYRWQVVEYTKKNKYVTKKYLKSSKRCAFKIHVEDYFLLLATCTKIRIPITFRHVHHIHFCVLIKITQIIVT